MSIKVVEITLISCEGLTTPDNHRPLKKHARGVIRTPQSASVVRSTSLDRHGGAYPRWDERFTVEMPAWARWLDVEVWSGMERLIGTARVPASDFSGGIVPDGYLNFLSYRLREGNGEFNGIVNVSVRVVGRKLESRNGAGFGCALGVPGRVVTGIPVSNTNSPSKTTFKNVV
uniref:C2 domain-containing protein n=1 Tax=Kalanchoe fedtschenkoi TaxID=63787 RepID=A0A7N0SZ81_KALFE